MKLRNFILIDFITLRLKHAEPVTLKKVFAISLIFCLFLPVAGTIGYLHLEKKKHRKEIKKMIFENLSRENLVTLSFTQEESVTKLNWKHDGEFEYKGSMYDIVEREIIGDSIIYHCILDHKESRINREIGKAAARAMGQDPAAKHQSERLANFLKTLINHNLIYDSAPCLPFSTLHHASCLTQYHPLFLSPPTPPPKTV